MATGKRRYSEAEKDFAFERLEPRIMLSADPLLEPLLPLLIDRDGESPLLDTGFDTAASVLPVASAQTQSITLADFAQDDTSVELDDLAIFATDLTDGLSASAELIVIDAAVEDRDALLQELLASRPDTRFNILLLEAGQSGVDQLEDYLAGRENITAVHLLTHGNGDGFWLGSDYVSASRWAEFAPRFSDWSGAFDSDADWLLYGCELASTPDGQSLLQALGDSLGVDVAASDDLTGAARLGGDWQLEFNYGQIEVASLQAQGWGAVLAAPQQGLLMTTNETVDSIVAALVPGLSVGWSNGEVLNFTDPNLQLGEATNGTFSSVAELNPYASDFAVRLDGLHVMQSDLLVGAGGTAVQLYKGDLLFSTRESESFGSLNVDNNDVAIFRPDTVGDYSSGSVSMLLDAATSTNLRDFAMVETTMTVGGQPLAAGTFLFGGEGVNGDDIHYKSINSAGLATTVMSAPTTLVFGELVGFSQRITGIELVQKDVTLGGMALSKGELLLAFDPNSVVVDSGETAFFRDIIRMQVTGTGASSAGNLDFVLDGSDVGLLNLSQGYTGLALYDIDANSLPTGSVSLSGTATENQTLSVSNSLADADGLGTISYQWLRDGADITGETGSSYSLVDADVGASITVRASYTDGGGTAEVVVSNALGPVLNVNDDPTGAVMLSGTAEENQTLTVSNDLADEDGIATAISYQWLRNGADITGETGSSYTLVDADVGKTITVRASYTDGFNTAEVVVSNALGPVTNVNDDPTGAVTLSGTPAENQTLSVTNSLADEDGLGTISYQWLRDGADITGETGGSYTLVDADVGKTITVRASYTDGFGNAEVVVSNALGPVTNVNDDPTGSVTLSGTAEENQTLSVSNDLADEDGLGTISYQWLRDGADITGETGSSYALVDADVGKTITVRASYTDGFGSAEVVVSNALGPVTNVNDDPTGSVTLSGTPSKGQTLSVAHSLGDDDGLGTISYQWYRDAVAISGATGNSYTLVDADVGSTITVEAGYVDGFGTSETVLSNALGSVLLGAPQQGLLMSTSEDVSSMPGVPGLSSWTNGEVLNLANPNLSLGSNTDGTFFGLLDFSGFAQDGDVRLDGMHIMGSDLLIGTAGTSYQLLQGDMLFSTKDTEVLSGLAISSNDLVLYRPASLNDYSSGTFMILLQNPTGGNLRDFAIVEQTITIAGKSLVQGSWLFTADDESDNDVQYSEISSVLAGTTSIANQTRFVDGSRIDIGEKITGVELIQSTGSLGAMALTRGDLLLSFEIYDDKVGDNQVEVFARDIARLQLTGYDGDTAGNVDVVLDGADVGLSSLTQGFTGIALYNLNSLPLGDVTLSGIAAENQTLSVSNSLSDADGLGPVSYQWYRDAVAISGETGTSYILTDADVNASITVRASYTDGGGVAEAVDSNALGPVTNVNDAPTGSVTLSGTPTENQTLSVTNSLADEDGLGTISYQWLRDGADITGETGSSYTLVDADVGKTITVRASYTDGFNTAEVVVSNALGPVTNVNDAPSGSVTLSGTPTENQTLSVTNSLADEDGLGTISYQWLRDGADITGETGSSYTLVDADVGKTITVRASYTDGFNTAEVVVSNALGPVTNINDAPTGAVTLSGTPAENQTLSVTNSLADEDGLGTISYQWLRDGADISGETGSSYSLVDADVGKTITVRASYTDGFNTAEVVVSNALGPVTNVNDAPSGSVTLSGTPTENQTLSVTNSLADEDGLGTISYQWLRDGVDITGETGSSYTLVDADVGASITVRASYTDGFNTAEVVVSNALGPVTNINDTPTGNVTLSGTPTENQTLSVTNSLADEDGLGSISYQWLRDGADITGETGNSYTLVDADVGASITVRASYTDGFDTAEVVVSNSLGPVTNVNDAPTGSVTLSGTATENQTLSVTNSLADEDGLGTISYQWLRDGVDITGEIGNSYTLVDADVGKTITVRASYSDGFGTAEVVVSNSLGPVTNVNDAPTGSVTLSGTATENQTLTVSDDLADEDGLGTISYQWLRDGADITGETGSSYTLVDADVGASITVRASYTDGFDTAEVVVSNALGPVTNVNDAPTGSVTLSGTPTENQTLTVSDDLADEDGLGTISYQWLRDGVDITGETGNSYTLVDADVGKTITVRASYTDGFGTAEVVVSNALGPVTNVNDDPTGSVTLSGTATENQTLTVSNDLADEDGLGTISYQWLRDGADITGETGNSYTLVDADVGASITVRASYTDGFDTAEVVVSNALGPVTNVNDDPTGSVTLSGTPAENQTLTVSNDLADEDGLGTISYQWLRDGADISGETGSSYTLVDADVGKTITVRASYTDGFGTAEVVVSNTLGPVTNVNDAPSGSVTLSGTATENQTLSVTNSLADEDGLGTISYQWLRDGADITGETGNSYTLVDADVGASITVRASYTDGFNTAEVVVSNTLGPVTNVNDAPSGSVTLSGTATENQTLSVTNSLADEDGLGTISYQWLRDGADITGETGSSYTLVDADVGASITVRASYTDGFNTAEVVVSNALGPVTNVNDDPTGSVTLSGTAEENQTLTVSNDLADEDGLGTISYQWLRDGVDITGETGNSYTLVDADVGASITVRASYTDGFDTAEVVVSNALGPVLNVNDDPTGNVTLSGTPAENQTLSVTNSLADEDGLGTISYQWLRDGADITGETGNSYTLVDADVGTTITVRASYTDGFGTAEVLVSNALGPVTNVNDAPSGSVTLSGTAEENQTLSVTNSLADEDGLGTISYQWLRDGADITGETGNSYTLVDADVGTTITVRASYTDGFNTAEVVVSNALGPVINVNDTPSGNVEIIGKLSMGELVQAAALISDDDGMGPLSYQWLRDGVAIPGATSGSYVLQAPDLGAQLGIRVSFIDGFGQLESLEAVVSVIAPPAVTAGVPGLGGIELFPEPDPSAPEGPGEFAGTEVEDDGVTDEEEVLENSTRTTVSVHAEDSGLRFALLNSSTLEGMVFQTPAEPDSDNTLVEKTNLYGYWKELDDSFAAMLSSGLITDLEGLEQQLKEHSGLENAILGGGLVISAGLSAGYVVWLLRSGVLLSSVMTSLPAWRFVDPLPVLAQTGNFGEEDSESLQSILDDHRNNSIDDAGSGAGKGQGVH